MLGVPPSVLVSLVGLICGALGSGITWLYQRYETEMDDVAESATWRQSIKGRVKGLEDNFSAMKRREREVHQELRDDIETVKAEYVRQDTFEDLRNDVRQLSAKVDRVPQETATMIQNLRSP